MDSLSPALLLQAIISAVLLIATLAFFLLRFARGRVWVIVALGIALFDQASKFIIIHFVKGGKPVSMPGGAEVVYFENRLMGFGGTDPILLGATLACVAALILLYLRLRQRNYRMGLAVEISCALILGGCLGILIDRAGRGFVIDWIDFGPQSEFIYNIADLAVVAAAVLLVARVARLGIKGASSTLRAAAESKEARRVASESELIGRGAAKEVQARLGALAPREIATTLGIRIEHERRPPPGFSALFVRGEYQRDRATIVLYDEPLARLKRIVARQRPELAGLDLEGMHILHEVFHHLEVEHDATSEQAAHYFASELLGLDFDAEELDALYVADEE